MRKLSAPMTILRLAGAVALAMAAHAAYAEAPFSFGATPGKLPKDVVPIQYVAHLVPDVAANTFSGSETIEIKVLKATSKIMLNVANMDIDSASLSGKDVTVQKLTPKIDKEQQTLTFTLDKPLKPGKYSLAISFRGQINREARGMFAMQYKVDEVEKKMIATTMEPVDARRMLPLWDEPAFRSKFKLSVELPGNFNAFSNTPIDKQEILANGNSRVSFGVTPIMSSYLLVLVAGELERINDKQDGVDIGIVTTVGKLDSAKFALTSSKDLLHYYNNYFGVPYPLAKLDLIAIPGGFEGAMENWGGIVYNEAVLLYDAKKSTEATKQASFSVNAHEMAHQWFGNLVTMAWWDNLWLNEGFARWMDAKATGHFHPEWRAALGGLVRREGVMGMDARKTTHPIQTPVLTEEQALDVFDAITYVKGEAFINMLEAYLGEVAFRKGIRAYMAKHQFGNTTSADLWRALERASGKPVEKIASAWTTQPGFPLVSVSQVCKKGQRKITLAQEQFWVDEKPTVQRLWQVPVQIGVVGGKAEYTLLTTASTTITRAGCDGTLVADPQNVGYFRLQYDAASFDALAAQAQKLPDTMRLKLLTDTWSLVAVDRLPLTSYLNLAAKFKDEPRAAVWEAMLDKLGGLQAMAIGTPEHALMQRYMRELIGPKFKALGWDEKADDTVEDRKLRTRLASRLAVAGDESVVTEARARFARFQVDPASLPPSSLDFVMSVVGRYADEANYDALNGLMMKAQTTEERNRYGWSLAGALDPKLSARTLQLALSPTLPTALTNRFVPIVASNEHIAQAWQFAIANNEALLKTQDGIYRNSYFPSIVSSSANVVDADMLEAYVKDNFGPDAQINAKRSGAEIRVRAMQKALLLPQVSAALR